MTGCRASRSASRGGGRHPQTFFQLYWAGSRDAMIRRMERAKQAGAAGLIVTLDWSLSQGRDGGSPHSRAADAARNG